MVAKLRRSRETPSVRAGSFIVKRQDYPVAFQFNPENLFASFDEFKRGKRKKEDVMNFERSLEDNIFELYRELSDKSYRHSIYETFNIWDPKYRTISKACVKDRVVHHTLFNCLYVLFDKAFIFHAYSSRVGKGTHIGVQNLHHSMSKASCNFKKTCYALKCDIRQFFANVNHEILLRLISKKVTDPDILWLTRNIIGSYENLPHTGIPLGNVTSQLFANVYLNPLDQFVKHELKMKHYYRYADDFVILHEDNNLLKNLVLQIGGFLSNRLELSLHPQKLSIGKIKQGVDFLGYVCCPHYRVIRTKTKQRMFKKIAERNKETLAGERDKDSFNQTLQSYLGMLRHADSHNLINGMADLFTQYEVNTNVYNSDEWVMRELRRIFCGFSKLEVSLKYVQVVSYNCIK